MKTLFACGVDWQHELGEASDLEGSMPLYSNIEYLKAERGCWKDCGIVELKLELVKWAEPQDLFREESSDEGDPT